MIDLEKMVDNMTEHPASNDTLSSEGLYGINYGKSVHRLNQNYPRTLMSAISRSMKYPKKIQVLYIVPKQDRQRRSKTLKCLCRSLGTHTKLSTLSKPPNMLRNARFVFGDTVRFAAKSKDHSIMAVREQD